VTPAKVEIKAGADLVSHKLVALASATGPWYAAAEVRSQVSSVTIIPWNATMQEVISATLSRV
jgi:hypothetical protein